jgi:hypothetical protein
MAELNNQRKFIRIRFPEVLTENSFSMISVCDFYFKTKQFY